MSQGDGINEPDGGGDDVIKVVYQAVADFASLLREIATARAEVKRLSADIDHIGGTQQVTVKVTADAAQARTEIARVVKDAVVKVRLVVDAVAAKREIAQAVRDAVVKVRLVVDSVAARTQIRAALAKLSGTVDVAIRLDRLGAITAMRALIAKLSSMGPVRLRVDIDRSVYDALDALQARVDKLRADLNTSGGGGGPPNRPGGDEPGPERPPPTPRRPKADGDGKGADLVREWSGALSVVSLFTTAAAAAVPVAAAVALGVGAIGSALLAAGAASGIFAVAAIGDLARVKKAVDAYEKTGAPLEGQLGDVVRLVEQVKSAYNQLLKVTEQPVFDVFEQGLNLVLSLLPKLEPVITQVADGVSGAVDLIADAVDGPGLSRFLDFVGSRGPHAIVAFTRSLLDIGTGLGNVLIEFAPFIDDVLDGLNRLTGAFARWSAGLGDDPAFHAFIDYARSAIPQVIDLVLNLVDAAGTLISGLAPIGSVALSLANAFLEVIAATPAPVITALAGTLVLLGVGFKVTALVIAFMKAVRALAAVEAINALLVRFIGAFPRLAAGLRLTTTTTQGATTAVVGLRAAFAALAAATLIGAVITGIVLLVNKLSTANDDAAEATRAHRDAVMELGRALAENDGKLDANFRKTKYYALQGTEITGEGRGGSKVQTTLGDLAGQAGIDSKDLLDGSLGDTQKFSAVLGKLEALARAKEKAALAGVDENGVKLDKEAQGQALATADAARKAADAYAAQSATVAEATKAQQDATAAIGQTDTATDAATGAAKVNTATVKTQAEAYGVLEKAIAAAQGEDEASKPVNAGLAAIEANTAAQKLYQTALEGNSSAARAAVQAETDLTTAQQRRTDAQTALNQAVSDAKDRLIDLQRQLRDQPLDEKQLKLNARRAAEAYRKALNSGGVSADDLEQLQLDSQRADNTLQDFNQDKGKNKKRAKKELAKGVEGNPGVIGARRNLVTANTDLAKAQQRVSDTALAARTELALLKTKAEDSAIALNAAAGAAGLTVTQLKDLKKRLDKIKTKSLKIVVDTDEAMAKLQAVLALQLAPKILALHKDWSVAQVLAEAAGQAKAATPAIAAPGKGQDGYYTYAGGGPVAGQVRGPGGPTGDRVLTRLPKGGNAALSDSEHIWTALEVALSGGHRVVETMRAGVRAGLGPAMLAGMRLAGSSGLAGLPGPSRGPGAVTVTPTGLSAVLPAFRSPPPPPSGVPGYAGGGAVGAQLASPQVSSAVTYNRGVQVGSIQVHNPVPEKAGTSVYRAVRRLSTEADEG